MLHMKLAAVKCDMVVSFMKLEAGDKNLPHLNAKLIYCNVLIID